MGDGYFVRAAPDGTIGIAVVPRINDDGTVVNQGITLQADPLSEPQSKISASGLVQGPQLHRVWRSSMRMPTAKNEGLPRRTVSALSVIRGSHLVESLRRGWAAAPQSSKPSNLQVRGFQTRGLQNRGLQVRVLSLLQVHNQ
jgi:hypothetical protein